MVCVSQIDTPYHFSSNLGTVYAVIFPYGSPEPALERTSIFLLRMKGITRISQPRGLAKYTLIASEVHLELAGAVPEKFGRALKKIYALRLPGKVRCASGPKMHTGVPALRIPIPIVKCSCQVRLSERNIDSLARRFATLHVVQKCSAGSRASLVIAFSNTTTIMLKVSTVLVFIALVASCNAIWLYTAHTFNIDYNLYAIDTTTYTVYTIGKIRDADGDMFTVSGMVYDNVTRLLYAVGNSRASNNLKDNGIFAIDPLTAQGASTVSKQL
jgi:hypothetical protein